MTIDDKINLMRDELNKLILNNGNYDEIYRLSVALDDLIIKYYSAMNYNNKNMKN